MDTVAARRLATTSGNLKELQRLAAHPHTTVRWAVLHNYRCTPEMLDVLAKTTNSRDTHRLINEGALDGQQELDLLRDIASEGGLAEETMDYLARTDVQEVIAAHAGSTPGGCFTGSSRTTKQLSGQDDWESQMAVGMHRNALADTLTLLADEALNPPRECADQPDEWTADLYRRVGLPRRRIRAFRNAGSCHGQRSHSRAHRGEAASPFPRGCSTGRAGRTRISGTCTRGHTYLVLLPPRDWTTVECLLLSSGWRMLSRRPRALHILPNRKAL